MKRLLAALWMKWKLRKHLRRMKRFYKDQFVRTAKGNSIDRLGAWYAITRLPGERDAEFRARVLEHMKNMTPSNN